MKEAKVKLYSWDEYIKRFEAILNNKNPEKPYDNPDYFNYLKLNYNRQNRWLKKGDLNDDLVQKIKEIKNKQHWVLITEPWCGDAAHSIPFIKLIANKNPKIKLSFVWRDKPPFMINNYLTNGGKSVPKLIIRDSKENDLATWGPRPAPCQNLFHQLRSENADFEKQKIELQKWYNNDKGQTLQKELIELIAKII